MVGCYVMNIEFAILFLQSDFPHLLTVSHHKDRTPMIRAAVYTTMLQGCTINTSAEDLLVEVGPLVPLLVAVPLVAFVAFCSTASA